MDRRIPLLAAALAAAGWCAACSSEGVSDSGPSLDAGPPDAGADAGPSDAGFVPAANPALVQVPYGGGPLLAQVAIVTVTWAGDPLATQLATFDAWLPASGYWGDSLAEYGIAPGTQIGTLSIDAGELDAGALATLSDAEIQALLIAAVDGGAIPAPSPNLVAAVYPPPGTVVDETYGGVVYHGCIDFTGYHSFVALPGTGADGGDGGFLIYTVVPRCPLSGVSDLDATTWPASHEIAEAATDPFSVSGVALPGWALPIGASDPNGGELADLCLNNPRTIAGNLVTALYSNRAADAGARPCVPAPPGPMFGTVADSDSIAVHPGTNGQVSLLVYSSAPLDTSLTLRLIPYDPTALTAFASSGLVENGDRVRVTVGLNGGAPLGAIFTLEILLSSTDGYRSSTFVAIQAE